MNALQFPTVLMIMLCTRCTLGGAEKQYARVFEHLVSQNPEIPHRLLINRPMLNLLLGAGLLQNCPEHLIVIAPPTGRLALLHYVWACEQAVRKSHPDVIHPLLTGVYFALPVLLLHLHIPLLMSTYSYQFVPYRDRKILGIPIGATLKLLALHRASAVDALTNPIRNDLINRGVSGKKIFVAPCSFTDVLECNPTLKKQPWVVFLARFVDIKNPLLLAHAIPHILKSCPQTRFFFLGEGPLQSQIDTIVQQLDIADHVTIRFEPQPVHVLNQSSVFVSLQTEENYPSQSLLEAMACGNAIVATDVGETWRLVDEQNGVRIPSPPTPQALADAIVALLNDPHLSDKQRISRERVLTEHNPERFFEYITEVYRRAAQGPPSVRPFFDWM